MPELLSNFAPCQGNDLTDRVAHRHVILVWLHLLDECPDPTYDLAGSAGVLDDTTQGLHNFVDIRSVLRGSPQSCHPVAGRVLARPRPWPCEFNNQPTMVLRRRRNAETFGPRGTVG